MKLNQEDSFVIYRKPYSKKLFLITGKWSKKHTISNNLEFVIGEFPNSNPIYLNGKKSIVNSPIEIVNTKIEPAILSASKNQYLKTARNYINLCNSSGLKKIILSRVISTPNTTNNIYTIFDKLCSKYDHSFNYLLNHPKIGMWMGASPEELISGNKAKNFSTSALAGSKKWNTNLKWSKKEIEEQQYVKNYIEQKLKRYATNAICDSDLKTIRAGNVAHLKSTFKFKTDLPILDVVNKLHPTPAISGYPVKKSIELILENEPHKRSLYCGYIGEVSQSSADLFVNLRCMKINKNQLNIYVGGGITNLSNADDEWEETQIKSQTLLAVIKK